MVREREEQISPSQECLYNLWVTDSSGGANPYLQDLPQTITFSALNNAPNAQNITPV